MGTYFFFSSEHELIIKDRSRLIDETQINEGAFGTIFLMNIKNHNIIDSNNNNNNYRCSNDCNSSYSSSSSSCYNNSNHTSMSTPTTLVETTVTKSVNKIIRKRFKLDNNGFFTSSFINELSIYQLMRSITGGHPNIVEFYGADYNLEHSNIYVEAMDMDLKTWTSNTTKLERKVQVLPLFVQQMASALSYLHKLGIVHNDLKPQNIVVNTRGNINCNDDEILTFKLVDFGFSGPAPRIIKQCNLGGTIWSRPPESLAGRLPSTYDLRKLDMWSLGYCCLYILCNKSPIFGDDEDQILRIIRVNSSPPNSGDNNKLNPYISPYVNSCNGLHIKSGDNVYDNPTIREVFEHHDNFKQANQNCTIVGNLNPYRILKTYNVTIHDTTIIDMILPMLLLNPTDRTSSEQLLLYCQKYSNHNYNYNQNKNQNQNQNKNQQVTLHHPTPVFPRHYDVKDTMRAKHAWNTIINMTMDCDATIMCFELYLRYVTGGISNANLSTDKSKNTDKHKGKIKSGDKHKDKCVSKRKRNREREEWESDTQIIAIIISIVKRYLMLELNDNVVYCSLSHCSDHDTVKVFVDTIIAIGCNIYNYHLCNNNGNNNNIEKYFKHIDRGYYYPLLVTGTSTSIDTNKEMEMDMETEKEIGIRTDISEWLGLTNLDNNHVEYMKMNRKQYLDTRQKVYELYFTKQQYITITDRTTILDWIVSVCSRYKLRQKTFSHTVQFVDQCIKFVPNIIKDKLKLIAVACLGLAADLVEPVLPLSIDELYNISGCKDYTKLQILGYKKTISRHVYFDVTAHDYINLVPNDKILVYCRYIVDVALVSGICYNNNITPLQLAHTAMYLFYKIYPPTAADTPFNKHSNTPSNTPFNTLPNIPSSSSDDTLVNMLINTSIGASIDMSNNMSIDTTDAGMTTTHRMLFIINLIKSSLLLQNGNYHALYDKYSSRAHNYASVRIKELLTS